MPENWHVLFSFSRSTKRVTSLEPTIRGRVNSPTERRPPFPPEPALGRLEGREPHRGLPFWCSSWLTKRKAPQQPVNAFRCVMPQFAT